MGILFAHRRKHQFVALFKEKAMPNQTHRCLTKRQFEKMWSGKATEIEKNDARQKQKECGKCRYRAAEFAAGKLGCVEIKVLPTKRKSRKAPR